MKVFLFAERPRSLRDKKRQEKAKKKTSSYRLRNVICGLSNVVSGTAQAGKKGEKKLWPKLKEEHWNKMCKEKTKQWQIIMKLGQ